MISVKPDPIYYRNLSDRTVFIGLPLALVLMAVLSANGYAELGTYSALILSVLLVAMSCILNHLTQVAVKMQEKERERLTDELLEEQRSIARSWDGKTVTVLSPLTHSHGRVYTLSLSVDGQPTPIKLSCPHHLKFRYLLAGDMLKATFCDTDGSIDYWPEIFKTRDVFMDMLDLERLH